MQKPAARPHTYYKAAYRTYISSASLLLLILFLISSCFCVGQSIPFPCTPLTEKGDLSSLMVKDVDGFLTMLTDLAPHLRDSLWHRDFSSPEAFNQSIRHERELLAKRLGVVDKRETPELTALTGNRFQLQLLETKHCTIRAVNWRVMEGLSAQGLLLQPIGKTIARIIMVPDADMLPEVLAGIYEPGTPGYGVARKLADAGWQVLIPTLVSRQDTFSGNKALGLYTNQPHREWIYRQAFEVGRHIIGYELQKIFSAVDWFEIQNSREGLDLPIGVAGYGEGGLLALHAAALDTRIKATLVSGYFDAREGLWQEPTYRSVFGLLRYFGDAELAVMSWPRQLIVEAAKAPEIATSPPSVKGRYGAAPGILSTPSFSSARAEWERASGMLPKNHRNLKWNADGNRAWQMPFSVTALKSFATGLKVSLSAGFSTQPAPLHPSEWVNTLNRQHQAVSEMVILVQQIVDNCERTRNRDFWNVLKGDIAQQAAIKDSLRIRFWEQIGRLPDPGIPANPRARLLTKTDKWTSYEVMLDVWPGVFTWGILLLPNNLEPGEKRPVVVCQHGLEGVPIDVVTTDPKAANYHFYRGYASRLADKGYIVFAPANIYRGDDNFRILQRKANPLGLSLFSVMIGQHQRIVEWLSGQSFVDSSRIAFYGLSYGGSSAMRIPAVVKGYMLSICSANFNEWVRKVASIDWNYGYVYNAEYEMPEWDLGHTFNYAEMAALIAPRPFMVERGYADGVGRDEWVSYEFGKVRRYYDLLGIPGSARIEYFNGAHTIHGVGTFEFLDHFLKWHPALP